MRPQIISWFALAIYLTGATLPTAATTQDTADMPKPQFVPPAAPQFGFIALNVADLERALSFYTSTVGLTEQLRHETPDRIEVGIDFPGSHGGPHILLVYGKAHKGPYGRGEVLSRFSFYVKNINELCRRIVEQGGKIVQQPSDRKGYEVKVRIAYALDPEGNPFELIESTN